MAFAGFDTGSFPGLEKLKAWRGNSPFQWVGFYLPAPCHSATGFTPYVGHRAEIEALGFGMAVIYVGRFQGGCGASKLSREQGSADGKDAVLTTLQEGFVAGSTIFLDVERFDPPMSSAMSDYIRGWLNFLKTSSQYNAGIYLHHANFKEISQAAQQEYADIGLPNDRPKYWVLFAGPPFDIATSAPTGCGIPVANIWQGQVNVTDEPAHGGVVIKVIDRDVADSANPSAPEAVSEAAGSHS